MSSRVVCRSCATGVCCRSATEGSWWFGRSHRGSYTDSTNTYFDLHVRLMGFSWLVARCPDFIIIYTLLTLRSTTETTKCFNKYLSVCLTKSARSRNTRPSIDGVWYILRMQPIN